jgi:hypothetical protein
MINKTAGDNNAGAGQLGQDSQNRTAATEKLRQRSWDRTAREQLGYYSQDRKERTGQTEHNTST